MKNGGFTLIELILVVAIGAILALGGFFAFSGYKYGKDLELTVNEMSSAVREVRQRSITQEDGEAWGIRFNSSSTGDDSYEIFYGTSYTATSVMGLFEFRRPVEFGEPSGGRTVDLEFEPITGEISNKKIISIAHKRDINETADILVNTLGKVTTRIESGIVGYWHFDEGTGTSTLDASGNDNTGELMNTPAWTAASGCKAGQCLEFNGSDEYINLGSDETLNVGSGSWSIGGWVKTTQSTWGAVVGGYDGYDIILYGTGPSGKARVEFNTGSCDPVQGAAASNDGDWHHIFAVRDFDNSKLTLYVDGEQVGENACVGTSSAGSENLNIGRENRGIEYFDGVIDEIRIYNRALSSSTIEAYYNDLR